MTSEFIQAAENFKPVLSRAADVHESLGRIPQDLVGELRAEGLLNLVSPRSSGGQETDFSTLFEVIATLAEGCMSTAWVGAVGNVHNWMATGFSAAAQEEYFASQDVFSAASFAPTGRAEMTADGFVASGTWSFLSGVDHADWVFLSGLVGTSIDDRPAGPWFMMIPISDVEVDHDSWQVTGLAGTGSKDVILEGVFVPQHRATFLPALRSNQGPGHGLHAGSLFETPFHAALIAILAAPIYGAGRGALEHFTNYTANRANKMTGARQAEQAAYHIIIAECAASVDAAGCILENIFHALDNERPADDALLARIPRDTAYAVRMINQSVNYMMANAGGNSAKRSNPMQRIWRDIQVASNHAALDWSSSAQAWGQQALAPPR